MTRTARKATSQDAAEAPEGSLQYVDLVDRLEKVSGERDWVVEGAIEANPIVVLSGPEKKGKSWMLIDLAISVASGTPWLGTFAVPKPGFAVVLDAEYGANEWTRRAKRLCAGRGLDPCEILRRIRYAEAQYGFMLSKMNGAFLELFRDLKSGRQTDVVIIDPFRNVLHGDENSAVDVLEAMRMLHVIRSVAGCPVVTAHHLNKSGGVAGSRAIRTRADLLIDGSDEAQPWYGATGRTVRTEDAIARRFTVRVDHENDLDDRIAKTKVLLRFESESTSKSAVSNRALRILDALKTHRAPASANELGKIANMKNGSHRKQALDELSSAGLAVQGPDGKWCLGAEGFFASGAATEVGQ